MCIASTADSVGGGQMIQLTRLNNQTLVVNCDLIKYVEKSPDTVISLVTGDKLVVRESVDEVLERVVKFRQSIASQPMARWDAFPRLIPKKE
jgi:flagellar protein FlbD